MKKLLFILLTVLVGLIASSQTTYYAYQSVQGQYNTQSKEWFYTNPKDVSVKIDIYYNMVYFNNVMGFKLISEAFKDKSQIAWNAVAPGNERCTIKVCRNSDDVLMVVFYFNNNMKNLTYLIDENR